MKMKTAELEGAALDASQHRWFKHGATIGKKTRAYIAWERMNSRCNNPNDKRWGRYGGRGIVVCERWKDFSAFLQDLGEPPVGLTLERARADGNYEPSNCRWATRLEQANNTTKTIRVEHAGRVQSLPEWCREFGLPYRSVWMRYIAGKRGDELFKPINPSKSRSAKFRASNLDPEVTPP